jgi:outer membrane protein assembly factor BamB
MNHSCWVLLALSVMLAADSFAQDWPRFRGANGDGVSRATSIPTQWTAADYHWQTDLPGVGHSSPVLWGDLLVATCGVAGDGTRLVLGLDAKTGAERWRQAFQAARHRMHQLNSFASATPALDELGVYVCWGTPQAFEVSALDHGGNRKWGVDLGPFRSGHGDGVSPIVHGERVLVAKEHEGSSEIVALDRRTGAVQWRVPRRSRSTWATPCLYTPVGGGAPQLICVSYEHGVSALDPETGQTIWESDVFDKRHMESTIASPVVAGDLVIGSSGWLAVRQEVIAVRPLMHRSGDAGGRVAAEKRYCLDRSAPLCTTPLVYQDLLFLWADEGIVTCADVRSGEIVWRNRVNGTFYASPIGVGGNVYNVSTAGVVVVLAAEREFREVGRVELGEPSHSTPAVAEGVMYLRTFSRLYALGGPGKQP